MLLALALVALAFIGSGPYYFRLVVVSVAWSCIAIACMIGIARRELIWGVDRLLIWSAGVLSVVGGVALALALWLHSANWQGRW